MIEIMLNDLVAQLITKGARRRLFDRGACLFHRGDQVRHLFILDQGALDLIRPQADGNPIVLQRAVPLTVIAEASLYSCSYHCDCVAQLPSKVYVLSKVAVLKRLRNDHTLSELWAAHLAGQVQDARYRCEILSRKTVAQRLKIWLEWHGDTLPPKGEWKGLAVQIGVSPEALYRELSRQRAA